MTENTNDGDPEVDPIDLLGPDATPEEVNEALGITADDGDGSDDGDGEGGEGNDDAGAGGEGGEEGEEGFRADGQPDWLPEKFKTPEDMAKSYGELEKTQGGKKKGPLSIKKAGEEADAEGGEGDGPRPLDQDHFNELGAEWYENDGKLTKETMDNLVDTYHATPEFINGMMQTQADKNTAADEAALVEAGISSGEEWNTIAQWGAKNLPESVAEGIDKMLRSPSQIQREAAVTKLKSFYDKRRGAKTERLSGNSGGESRLQPITSNSQYQKAMEDPLYFDEGPAGEKHRKQIDRRAVAGGLA